MIPKNAMQIRSSDLKKLCKLGPHFRQGCGEEFCMAARLHLKAICVSAHVNNVVGFGVLLKAQAPYPIFIVHLARVDRWRE